MKILHITKGFYPDRGGIEIYSYQITKELAKYYNVFVLATHSKIQGEEKLGKIKVIRLKKIFDFLHAPINSPFSFFKSIKKINPDIIHFHIPNPLNEIYLLLYCLFAKRPKMIATYHADIPHYTVIHKSLEFLRRFYLIFLMRLFDVVIATSKEYSDFSPVLKLFRNKIKVVFLGTSKPKKMFSTKKLKKIYKIKDEKIVLFVGRLFPYKGVRYFIEAASKVIKYFPKTKFFIVGSGEQELELKKIVEDLGLKDYVIFTGSVEDRVKNTFYKICDIFVLPSINRGEAFGISLIEAMSFGKPLVTTKIPGSGVNFVNKNKKTGLVVEPKNSEDLAYAILKLLKDQKFRIKLGKNAKKRFLKYFVIDKMLEKTISIYKSLENSNSIKK